MGSVSYHVEQGTSTKQAILDYLANDCALPADRIVDIAVKGFTGYVAIRRPDGTVGATVAKTGRYPRDYFNFNIKLMDEECGPYFHDCPARILDALSPTDNDHAIGWRKVCRANIERLAEAKKVKPGTWIKLDTPMPFTDGQERDLFCFEKGSTFRAADGVRVRVTSWRKRTDWSVTDVPVLA